jgi:transcriptional regulator with XRE-family HTH domain
MAVRRKSCGMSQERLAAAVKAYGLSFHQTSVSKIESGDRPVTLSEAYVIAEVLGTSIEAMTWGGEHVSDVTARLSQRVAELERAVGVAHFALSGVAP